MSSAPANSHTAATSRACFTAGGGQQQQGRGGQAVTCTCTQVGGHMHAHSGRGPWTDESAVRLSGWLRLHLHLHTHSLVSAPAPTDVPKEFATSLAPMPADRAGSAIVSPLGATSRQNTNRWFIEPWGFCSERRPTACARALPELCAGQQAWGASRLNRPLYQWRQALTVRHKHRHNCGRYKYPGYLCMEGRQAGSRSKYRAGGGGTGVGTQRKRTACGDRPWLVPPLPARREGQAALLPRPAHPADAAAA